MDADFFKELEESFANVGTDEVWKRTVGGRLIHFSPIPFTGQGKVQEALVSKDLGANVIAESKRITLSHAIVGIDDKDLSKFRHAGAVFGPVQLPGGKNLKVDLPTYVYMRMATWGSQFVDDAFAVFADLMETHGKENLKEVKFENAKNPVDELGELMVRVTELRTQLGLPPLVEQNEETDEVRQFEEEQVRAAEEQAQMEEQEEPTPEDKGVPFDPFKAVKVEEPVAPKPAHRAAAPQPVPQAPSAPPPPPPQDPPPITTLPVAAPPQNMRRAQAAAELEGTTSSSPSNPFIAAPSVPLEVIEAPAQRQSTAPPVIDPKQFGRNPRFNPPKQ